MSDQFSVVTKQGFGSRLGNSVKGMIVGFVFFIGAFPLLWFNEGRAVSVAKSLAEGAKTVLSVVADRLDGANEGKLVHLSGTVVADSDPADDVTGVSAQGLSLQREVEMYQWVEKEKREEVKKTGGGTETRTTYSYHQSWDDDRIDSGSFYRKDGHENPTEWAIRAASFQSNRANVGVFELGAKARSELGGWKKLVPQEAIDFPESFGEFTHIGSGVFYRGTNANEPVVGDMRVTYRVQAETPHSFVAKQAGERLEPFTTSNGRELLLVEQGNQTADKMFEAAQSRNSILTWILRGVGTFLMWIGLMTIFAPLTRLFDFLPFLGNLASKGVALISAVMSIFLSILTIGIAWVFYRPFLGITLIALAIGLIVWMRKGKAKAATPPSAPTMGPPSMGPPMAPPPPPPAA